MGLLVRALLFGYGIYEGANVLKAAAGGVREATVEGTEKVTNGLQIAIVLGVGIWALNAFGKKG